MRAARPSEVAPAGGGEPGRTCVRRRGTAWGFPGRCRVCRVRWPVKAVAACGRTV